LTTGAGLAFSDRGVHALKGVAEPEQLFAAVADMLDAGPAATRRAAVGASRPAGLSAREVDVLRLVASGLSDAEVAERLFLSVRTVNAHLRSIYRKAGVRSRAAAGRFAEENGLV
jgi:DNA-binding NarL/FixJ family response regulator